MQRFCLPALTNSFGSFVNHSSSKSLDSICSNTNFYANVNMLLFYMNKMNGNLQIVISDKVSIAEVPKPRWDGGPGTIQNGQRPFALNNHMLGKWGSIAQQWAIEMDQMWKDCWLYELTICVWLFKPANRILQHCTVLVESSITNCP